MSAQRQLTSTAAGGLNRNLPPMRLWAKAKRVGIWDPADIPLEKDREDWLSLSDLEREVLLHLTSLFQAGEESVTLDLLPLIQVIASEGRLEEEMFLTSFLWEEAKHVDFFSRVLSEVFGQNEDLSRFMTPSYQAIFYDALPQALTALREDSSPVAQATASVTYNMIVEGVLAETGYHSYYQMLTRNNLMPGIQEGIGYLKSDEARHIAYGVFLLSRLVIENGDEVWEAIERRMGELLPQAIMTIHELFGTYETMPFGLEVDELVGFATSQFERRIKRIEKARNQTMDDILKVDTEAVVAESNA